MKLLKRLLLFYIDGFKNIGSLGKKLWIIIFIKLFILFLILKLFFFPDFLKTRFSTDQERGDYVIEVLTKKDR